MIQNKKVTDILKTNAWEGHRCFIIGGGPSLEGFAPERLDSELTIGVNKSFIKFNSTILYGMDYCFLECLEKHAPVTSEWEFTKQCWKNYKGLKVFLKTAVIYPYVPIIYVVKRIEKRQISTDLEAGIYAGNNSGFGALMLAIVLGANPIYLLGFDMSIDKTKTKTHWHKGYENQLGDTQPPRQLDGKLKGFRKCFNDVALEIAQMGKVVINLNPNSALESFKKQDVNEII